MERIKDIKAEAERYYEDVGITPTPEDLIEYIYSMLLEEGEQPSEELKIKIKESL